MEMRQIELRSARDGSFLGAGLALCACAAVVGLFCAATQIESLGPVAVGDSKLDSSPTINSLQAAVDTSPAAPLPAIANAAVPIPVARSTSLAKLVIPRVHSQKAKAPLPASSDVLRFNECLPQCETKDPMIAGYPLDNDHAGNLLLQASDDHADEPGFSPLKDATYVVSRVADASGAALKGGRKMLDHVIPTDW
ncbi:hypothetical protein [Rhizobium jaguaris]|uniref:Uncharacterized protein n=1 Tax=Rhizobium jaguaris TaxID=1312183 RepID=A0A387G3C3_9HYPH|nr:hypothetical protein [Rhizobium jaguaris]AYG62086.1 hypothetical protein CCGE525_24845 [Rhizobium jaguaris]